MTLYNTIRFKLYNPKMFKLGKKHMGGYLHSIQGPDYEWNSVESIKNYIKQEKLNSLYKIHKVETVSVVNITDVL